MEPDREGTIQKELRKLPQVRPPAELRTALRVMASRELQAVVETRGSRWQRWWQSWKFRLELLVNPLTLPATGGIFSSFVLFALLSLTIGRTTHAVAYEVPVIYADENVANLVPVELRSDVIVTFSLDRHGYITDYAVNNGPESFVGDVSQLQARSIPLPQFPSVLALAQPITSDVSIRFTPLLFRQ